MTQGNLISLTSPLHPTTPRRIPAILDFHIRPDLHDITHVQTSPRPTENLSHPIQNVDPSFNNYDEVTLLTEPDLSEGEAGPAGTANGGQTAISLNSPASDPLTDFHCAAPTTVAESPATASSPNSGTLSPTFPVVTPQLVIPAPCPPHAPVYSGNMSAEDGKTASGAAPTDFEAFKAEMLGMFSSLVKQVVPPSATGTTPVSDAPPGTGAGTDNAAPAATDNTGQPHPSTTEATPGSTTTPQPLVIGGVTYYPAATAASISTAHPAAQHSTVATAISTPAAAPPGLPAPTWSHPVPFPVGGTKRRTKKKRRTRAQREARAKEARKADSSDSSSTDDGAGDADEESESDDDARPAALLGAKDANRLSTQAIGLQYPVIGVPTGKEPKRPYDYLPQNIKREMKAAKLKKKLPPLIYVCGYLSLLAEPMEPTSALAANLWHLADVAQDAAGLPWDNVREWADAMRYYSDCCGKSWHDT